MPTLSRVFLVVLALSAPLAAQRTWIVDQGLRFGANFADLPEALAQLPQSDANPGRFRGVDDPVAQCFQGAPLAEGRVVPTTPVDRGA